MMTDDKSSIPYGYCQCGCGEKTKLITQTDRHQQRIKGMPNRYLNHHNRTPSMNGVFIPRPYRCRPVAERFWEKVDKSKECWEWTATKDKAGYGLFRLETRRTMRHAHRVAYELAYSDPGQMYVLHKCDNKGCVRPDHLFLGTHADNMADAGRKGILSKRNRAKGTQLPQAKLTEADIPVIRKLYRDKIRISHIAKRFGVSFGAIKLIIIGRNWKSVP